MKLFKEKKRKTDKGELKKSVLSNFQIYILYDKAGAVKPTFVGDLEHYVNIFSQFTILFEKSNKNPKNFTKKNKKKFSVEK